MAWEALGAAGISALGNLAGGMISSAGQSAANQQNMWLARDAQQFNERMANQQMAFQREMSNTAYQRAVTDMRAAGLNPILAYQQGGASSPMGASASAPLASVENAMDALGEGVSSASQGAERFMQLKQLKEQTEKTKNESEFVKTNTALNASQKLLADQNVATSAAQAAKARAETLYTLGNTENLPAVLKLLGAQAHSARASGDLSDEQRKQLKEFGPHWTGQAAGSIARAFSKIFGGGLTSPTDPRLYGLKGRPGPSPGLVIDITK